MKKPVPPRQIVVRTALAAGCRLWTPIALPAADATKGKAEQKCVRCLHFIAESNTCKLAAGQIGPEGWCNSWANKA